MGAQLSGRVWNQTQVRLAAQPRFLSTHLPPWPNLVVYSILLCGSTSHGSWREQVTTQHNFSPSTAPFFPASSVAGQLTSVQTPSRNGDLITLLLAAHLIVSNASFNKSGSDCKVLLCLLGPAKSTRLSFTCLQPVSPQRLHYEHLLFFYVPNAETQNTVIAAPPSDAHTLEGKPAVDTESKSVREEN